MHKRHDVGARLRQVKQQPDSGDFGSAVISFGNGSQNEARFLLSLDIANDRAGFGFYNNDISSVELTTGVWNYLV